MGTRRHKGPTPAVFARALLCAASRLPRERPGTSWDDSPLARLSHPPCNFCGVPAAALLNFIREEQENNK